MKTIKVKSAEEALITKYFPCEVVKESEEELLVDFTVQKIDRDNEILLVKGARLKHYRENPIIQADHDFSVRATVGHCKWVRLYPKEMPDRIRIKPLWGSTPFALDVKSLVEEGHLKTVSHTFYGWEYVTDEDAIKELAETFGFSPKGVYKVFTDWEPLEVSWVSVPACTDAVVVMAEAGILKTKYFKERIFGMKPFPNEHSARIKNPSLFSQDTFRRKKDGTIYGSIKVPSTAAVIWAKLKEHDEPADNPIPQSLRFPKEDWTAAQAKKWLKDNNVKYETFEPAGESEDVNLGEDPKHHKDRYAELTDEERKILSIAIDTDEMKIDSKEDVILLLSRVEDSVHSLRIFLEAKARSGQGGDAPSGDQDGKGNDKKVLLEVGSLIEEISKEFNIQKEE